MFREDLTAYYESAGAHIRHEISALPCDRVLKERDDFLLKHLVTDVHAGPPVIEPGEPEKKRMADRATYTHRVTNSGCLKWKPNGYTFQLGGVASAAVEDTRLVITVRCPPGMEPEQVRAQHESQLALIQKNIDLLTAQIQAGNDRLNLVAAEALSARRKHCESLREFESKM